ncbi:MAG: endonuclease III [bacterium]|nr:endonuclease III [bacterium]
MALIPKPLPKFKNESANEKKKRAGKIITALKKKFPEAIIALRFSSPWELLVAVILSAQCTDKKVNEVTEVLFKKYKTIDDYASADKKEFEKIIYSTGFYHAKAKNILATAKLVKEKFGGIVPRTMQDLLTLKGVARKTANVVLGNAYEVVDGIAVDTHVLRIAQRLGLSFSDKPVIVEKDLMKLIPKNNWLKTTYLIIEHGRAICTAKDPHCDFCPLKKICPSAFQFPKFQKN